MAEEIIDIVDENDNVIGTNTKKNAHLNKLWHRTAHILIFKDESLNETLLQKRSKNKDQYPGLLAQMGGHLNSGDTYLQGALRELCEEMLVGLTFPNVDLTPLFKLKDEFDHEFRLVYRWVYSGPFKADSKEVEDFFFVKLSELFDDIKKNPQKYTPGCKFIFSEYQQRCPKPLPDRKRGKGDDDSDEEEEEEEFEDDEEGD